MDPDTARLALDLQLQDIAAILKTHSAEADDAAAASEAVAFSSLRDELLKKKAEIDGRCAAVGILRKEHADLQLYQRLLVEERVAQADHAMACRLTGRAPAPQPPIGENGGPDRNRQKPTGDAAGLANAIDLGGTQTAHAVSVQSRTRPAEEGSASLRDANTRDTKRVKLWQRFEAAALAYKSHAELFDNDPASTLKPVKSGSGEQDEPIMDRHIESAGEEHVRCGDEKDAELPVDSEVKLVVNDKPLQTDAHDSENEEIVENLQTTECSVLHCTPFLPEDLLTRFQEKKEELETPDRIYCSNVECAKWIKPKNIEADVATCSACAQTTCATCKAKHHDGLCPDDENVTALLALAKEKQWNTCPKCKNMVELNTGCYHMM
ncbi:hypothetical protein N0V90_006356 [Kalmusia sp. IMI 367209]|nr:hypothetical protein N0V90_006356 [Kalmusia sp. IMI 367209]